MKKHVNIPDDLPRDEATLRNLINVERAAEEYGVGKSTIRRWLRQGKVRGWKVLGAWGLDRRSLEKYLEERRWTGKRRR